MKLKRKKTKRTKTNQWTQKKGPSRLSLGGPTRSGLKKHRNLGLIAQASAFRLT